jgi:hypothetical protein
MRKTNIFIIAIITISILIFLSALSFSQQMPTAKEGKKLTQAEFAKNLCRTMKLGRSLPLAPVDKDYFDALEGFGIAPLTGWKSAKDLTEEDYVVVMAFAAGEGKLVVDTAKEACDRYAEIITKKWKLYHDIEGRWPTLEELTSDKNYFPYGPPVCPYRKAYKDKNNDHIIEKHRHW